MPSGAATGSGPGKLPGAGAWTLSLASATGCDIQISVGSRGGGTTRPARCTQADTRASLTWHSTCSKAAGSTRPSQLRTTCS